MGINLVPCRKHLHWWLFLTHGMLRRLSQRNGVKSWLNAPWMTKRRGYSSEKLRIKAVYSEKKWHNERVKRFESGIYCNIKQDLVLKNAVFKK